MSAKSPKTIDLHIAKRIRIQRIACAITQQQLAKKTGITFQQIQKYENGKNRVSCSRLAQFAAVFGVTPGAFFEGLPLKQGARNTVEIAAITEFATLPHAQRLMQVFGKLPTVHRNIILDLCEMMAALR